jgi:transcriptional regulator with XRE-family HTH domain
VDGSALLRMARLEAGLTQDEVARRAHTSRPTLSAYEQGRKSPSLDTAQRLLAATGHELEAVPLVGFSEHHTERGRSFAVPNRLARLPFGRALATITLPLHLNWSAPGRVANLADRRQRARVYEVVLREGRPDDIRAYIDGVLLADLWDELVLPRGIREAWTPVVSAALADAA